MDTLRGLAKALNTATFRNMDVRQDTDLETATWDETEEEIKKGGYGLTMGNVKARKIHWPTLQYQAIQRNSSH
jgi:hypothetical protein